MLTHLKLTPAIIQALRPLRIYSRPGIGDACRLIPGESFALDTEAVIEPYVAFCGGRTLNPTGSFSYSHSPMDPIQEVGRYCSIAVGVKNFSVKHPIEFVSTSHFNFANGSIYWQALADRGGDDWGHYKTIPYNVGAQVPAKIGHDVWIGEGALLARNIEIGTGAIIGANSVVTKDVPPYAIVGGVPAKLIRWRFPETVVEKLLESRWWEYHFGDFNGLNYTKPEVFVGQLSEAVAAGKISPYVPDRRTFLVRLVEALKMLGEPAPSNLTDLIQMGRLRAEREALFPVPKDCATWLPPELDPRDKTLFRFFGHRAWLDVPHWGSANHLELLSPYAVNRQALRDLTVSINGVPLELARRGEDALRRPLFRFILPPTPNRGPQRIHLHCDSVHRPALLNPTSTDQRSLSLAIGVPRFV